MTSINISSGFPKGKIILDSENDTYWAGSRVSGNVQFTLLVPTSFKELRVMLEGEARVNWTESKKKKTGDAIHVSVATFSGRENYFQFIVDLAGGPNGPITLGTGTHTYSFQYQMPRNLPSSFVSKFGRVQYRAIAFTDLGRDNQPNLDHAIIKHFDVVVPCDLNEIPNVREPIQFEFEEAASGCFKCNSDLFNVQLSLPHSGYCPGQVVPIDVKAENKSSAEIRKIRISLRKKIDYRSQVPPSEKSMDEEILACVKRGPVLSKCIKNFTAELEIPEDIDFNIDVCQIINISYYLKVQVKLTGCNEDCEDEADIIIGTVPLIGFQDVNYQHPLASKMPNTPFQKAEIPRPTYPTNTPYPSPGGASQVYPGYPYPGTQASMGNPPPYSVGSNPNLPQPALGFSYSGSKIPFDTAPIANAPSAPVME